jgi:hypothetical protein
MMVLHRVNLMGIFIATAVLLIIVPLHWYPFARISEQLYATESCCARARGSTAPSRK